MDEYRALYEIDEHTPFGEWLVPFWDGNPPPGDPLWELLEPQDLRGEVRAFGDDPHGTCLDALTVWDPDAFAKVVKRVCAAAAPPLIRPRGLAIYGGTALVVEFRSAALQRLRLALAEATRHLIARAPLADEEFQRAEWWVRRVGKDEKRDVRALHKARDYYIEAGAPPLPRSRHFRLGFYMRLYKEFAKARKTKAAKARRLRFLFDTGLPYWYRAWPSFHKTIASGLTLRTGRQTRAALRHYNETLWPVVQEKLTPYRPEYLAIMGDRPEKEVEVKFYDWLTETYVEEKRPAFTVVGRTRFGSRA